MSKRVLLSTAAAAVLVVTIAVAMVSIQQQTEIISGQLGTSTAPPGSVLKLSSASVPIDIPLIKGYENGNEIFFVATDISDRGLADLITDIGGFKVNFAPLLAQTPEGARGQIYVFENGV